MIPPLIVRSAHKNGINLIAVTDHNASANAGAVMQAASGTGLIVLPGMELQTREDVHLLCLFDTLEQLEAWQAVVDSKLPDHNNNIKLFGEQFVVDSTGDFIRREKRMLLASADISLDEAVNGVRNLGGLPIPAHVDRKANGLISILGFIPEIPRFDALEVSNRISIQEALSRFPQLKGYPLLQSGDIHYLDDFSGRLVFHLEEPTLAEISMAIKGKNDRDLSLQITDNLHNK